MSAAPPPQPNSPSSLFLAAKTPRSLAIYLGIPYNKLNFLLYGKGNANRYKEFSIRKRNGETRTIFAPSKPLKELQRKVSEILYEIYKPRPCVTGFVSGRGIVDNARIHANHRWLLRVDLEDFFPSINFGRVRGLFLAAPFSFPASVATVLAQLATFRGHLPQGAPTSPIISNFLCRGLDFELIRLAQQRGCYYTRYADDLIFSSNRRTFPQDLAYFETEKNILSAVVGHSLRSAIERAGFKINSQKTTLRRNNSRQVCTGLVVNEKPNVRREYVRQIRAMLHSWRRFGLEGAGQYFLSKHDKRNRPKPLEPKSFQLIVRGRIQHIGSVKGWNHPVYIRLAESLLSLDKTFIPKTMPPVAKTAEGTISVYTEGKTDRMHLETALRWFQAKGEFSTLRLDFQESPQIDGDKDLLKHCKIFAAINHPELFICIFDRDVQELVPQVTDGNSPFRAWGKRVYSLSIPIPKHRQSSACIETYYTDNDLRLCDKDGRRLFLREEFDEKGFHKSGQLKMDNSKNQKLVVEEPIYDLITKASMGLTKSAFATMILNRTPPFDQVDFEAFKEIFELITKISELDAGAPL